MVLGGGTGDGTHRTADVAGHRDDGSDLRPRDLGLPSGAGLSAGFMIVIAAIVVFSTHHTPLGVLLVGLCGGLYLPQLKRRDWRKILYNTGSFGIAMTLGYVVMSAFPAHWLA